MKSIIKKNILIIFIFSIVVMLPMLWNFEYVGHDAEFHFLNIRSIVNQLSWNNWFVREPLSLIANNFGYGVRFFYPPMPHLIAAYIAKFLQLFNINNILISMRITGWLTILLSGITFYLLGKKIFKNNKVAMLGSLFYMSAPYHIAEIYIRDAFSEMFIFIAIPLIILGLLELKDKKYKNFYIYFTLGYTISIYSHMAVSIYLTLILLSTFFIVYLKEIFNKKSILWLIVSSVSILCFTAPFWLTLLEVKLSTDYTIFVPYYLTAKGDLQYSTLKLSEYLTFSKPHTFDNIRHHLQLSITLMIFVSMFISLKNKLWKKKTFLFLFLFFVLSVIMTTNLFPWAYIPSILQTLQFPWRLTLFVQFSGILLAMIFLNKISTQKWFGKVCILLMILCTAEMFYNTYHLDKTMDINNISTDYGMGNEKEYLPHKTTLNKEYYNNRTNDILILNGNATINIIKNDISDLIFEIEVKEESNVEFPRLYYIGYQLTNNKKNIEIKESENGFLQASINESGTYELKYTGTTLMKISYILFGLNLIIHLFIYFYYKIIKKRLFLY